MAGRFRRGLFAATLCGFVAGAIVDVGSAIAAPPAADAGASGADANTPAAPKDAAKQAPEDKQASPDDAKPAEDAAPTSDAAPIASPGLSFLETLAPGTPKAKTLGPVLLRQMQESGVPVSAADGAQASDGCAQVACLDQQTKAKGARFAIIGAITQNGAVDVLQMVIFDVTTQQVVGRLREEGRGETAFIQRTNLLVTRLFASAELDKEPEPMLFFGVLEAGTPVDTADQKPIGQRFPVLSLAGATVASIGVLLVGVGVLFGITANSNHAQAVGAATQVDAAALVDQRDTNAFFANGLFLVGTAVVLGGATTLGLGLAWGE